VQPRIRPAGDGGLAVEFEERIDPAVLARVVALDRAIAAAAPRGVTETVPAYRTLLVLFDPLVADPDETARAVAGIARGLPDAPALPPGRRWTLPVAYGGAHGEDLAAAAAALGLAEEEVVRLHAGAEYLVFMIGFSPGYAYLGPLDPRLHLPRRPEPRARVPAGSVAVGGQQTAVFSMAMPSGWSMLGRTPVRTFAPGRAEPFLFAQGDRVRFEPVGAAEFDALAARADAGEIVARREDPA
jgi:KipI family sensor histidine kinase inhibitor